MKTAISPPLFSSRERIILFVLLTSQFMLSLDFSIVTVALPALGKDLGIATSDLQWVVTIFALASTSLILVMGRIAERFGRKHLFLIGMALLTVASTMGGLAQSAEILLTARALQGIAIAITTPTVLGLLTASFAEGPLRTKALSYNGLLLTLGFSAGSLLGGALTDLLGWRFTFFINVPIGVAVFVLALALVRKDSPASATRVDLPGAVVITAALVAFVLWLREIETGGIASLTSGLLIASAVALFAVFGLIERNRAHPLVQVALLARPSVFVGNLGGIVTVSMETAKAFLLTLYLQQVLHLSPLLTGLALGVLGVGCIIGSFAASSLINRWGAATTLTAGLALQGVTALTLVLLGQDLTSGFTHILVATFIGGFGHLLAVVAYSVVGTSGLSSTQQGTAASIIGMSFQIGMLVGIPVISILAFAGGDSHVLATGDTLNALRFGFAADAVFTLVAAAVVLIYRITATRVRPIDAGEQDQHSPHELVEVTN
ncbi:MFS transporter [Leucobacter viscericola]|uniref:MFS transporter n=1 Tax=Leucobacter viscericola TaxID=2714935 RepID=A0A6G7XIS4_9MICO|nr:MFS transporter [Leucobacter viscericola]QIK64271.1 MFS transporter [Leucobacter viscericola]